MSKKFTKKELAKANRAVGGRIACRPEIKAGVVPIIYSKSKDNNGVVIVTGEKKNTTKKYSKGLNPWRD